MKRKLNAEESQSARGVALLKKKALDKLMDYCHAAAYSRNDMGRRREDAPRSARNVHRGYGRSVARPQEGQEAAGE